VYKHGYLFKTVMYNNLNVVTKSANLALHGDETTFTHNGYGKPNSWLLSIIMGNPGVTRGGHIVLFADVSHNHPHGGSTFTGTTRFTQHIQRLLVSWQQGFKQSEDFLNIRQSPWWKASKGTVPPLSQS
jgi:hypothetical protein